MILEKTVAKSEKSDHGEQKGKEIDYREESVRRTQAAWPLSLHGSGCFCYSTGFHVAITLPLFLVLG